MSIRIALFRSISLASLGLFALATPLPAAADGAKQRPTRVQKRVPKRPAKGCVKDHQASSWRERFEPAYTAKEKVTAKIFTWDGQAPRRTTGGGGDPYQGHFTGYRDGTTITVKALRGHEVFVVPGTSLAVRPEVVKTESPAQEGNATQQPTQQHSAAPAQTSAPAKPLSRTAKRKWRKAYSAAERWELIGMGRNVDGTVVEGTPFQAEFRLTRSPGQDVVRSNPVAARLASHMPLRVFGKHEASGLKYRTVKTNAIGSPERPQRGQQNGALTPLDYTELSSITEFSNVHYRPLGERKADGSQELKVLGMAAYPPGAEVRISNPGTGEAADPFTAGQKRGGDFATVSVTAEHRILRIDVLYQGKSDSTEMSRSVHLTRYIRVPKDAGTPSWSTARAGKKAVAAAGDAKQQKRRTKSKTKGRVVSYFRPDVIALPELFQPARVQQQRVGITTFMGGVEVPQISVTPALKPRGAKAGTPGLMTIRWKEGAFKEGTFVTFANPRFPKKSKSVLIHDTMKRELSLEAFADDPHIQVTLTHPVAHNPPMEVDSVTTIRSTSGNTRVQILMPKIEGAPAEMGTVGDRLVPFYTATAGAIN
jgi:hypothetical protein